MPSTLSSTQRRRRRSGLAVLTAFTLGLPMALFGSAVERADAATSVSGVVNTYQAVSRIAGATLTLDGATAGAARAFAAGDRVLLIQMTGSNPAAGSSSLGVYERGTVASVAAGSLTLTAPVSRAYDPVGQRVQVVRVAYDAGTTTMTGTVSAPAWNGRTGGVVALAGGRLDLAGRSIDVTGDGFSTANPAYSTVIPGNRTDPGSTTGRGQDGAREDRHDYPGSGGGGIGGAGGAGGTDNNDGGNVGGGQEPATGATAAGTNGGRGGETSLSGGPGAGGGGGIIGGGGGGGGSDILYETGAGGGGVAGGGGGGGGEQGKAKRAGGGGGGVGSVGNGADATPGERFESGSAGGGGGSYGGGGGTAGVWASVADGNGGGGGGSWTGGGQGGLGKDRETKTRGGNGNAAVTSGSPANYLNRTDARLVLGGSGGRGSSDSGYVAGGAGGGIVYLDVATVTGGGSVVADGAAGSNATGERNSGAGGGGGGQVRVSGAVTGTVPSFSARGGAAGKGTSSLSGAGTTGGGGGGGGLWLEVVGTTTGCGTTVGGLAVTTSVEGGGVPANTTGLGRYVVASGTGGRGLICAGTPPLFSLGDRVWRDADADGVQDTGEPGVSGVGVTLLDAGGASVATTATDSAGRYSFAGLLEGSYRVRFATPSSCAYTVPQAGSDRALDSDVDPFTATTGAVALGPSTTAVDAGLVCSTTSRTSLGAYSSGSLSDLLPADAGPFDGATATAVMSQTGPGTTSFLLEISGISPTVAGTSYGSHLHTGPCVAGNGAAAGPHYNTDVLDGVNPPEISPRTEVWLDFTVSAAGTSVSSASVPFVPSAGERAIIVHVLPTTPGTGVAGARQACLPLTIK